MEVRILSVASRALVDACERLGLDGGELLARVGLSRAEVGDPDARIEASRADALWGLAYQRASDPFLALHAAEVLPFGAYKVIDYLGAHSATVGEALSQVVSCFRLIDPRPVLEITSGEPRELRMSLPNGAELQSGAQEYTFAAIVVRIRAIAGVAWPLAAVEFAFAAPPDDSEHRRIFGAPIRFGASQAKLLIPASSWELPIASADPALRKILEEHVRRLLDELPAVSGLASQVRQALLDELASRGDPSIGRIARKLAMSERTLQRRLKEEGLSFAAVLDQARAAQARAHLRDPVLSLAEVAWLSGFADQSTFTRAFKRWAGCSPGVWRARQD